MKFTLSWLRRHLDTTASVVDIGEALTDLGLEIEDIHDPADRLSEFTIGKVIQVEKHPDADRLRVCQVMTDDGQRQIICGAPNVRAGILSVVAKSGMYIPGIDTIIGVSKIRGVESSGMLCSEHEMEMSDEHDGIIELPSGNVGDRFVDWLMDHKPARVDPIFEIQVTPNRPDALGVRGIARDLAAKGLGALIPYERLSVVGDFQSSISVHIDPDTLDGCPLFAGRLIRNVSNGSSPEWLQEQLRAVGLRPISALVDITNFMTMDQARPLHVFDAGKITGNLRVHRAVGNEKIAALDDNEYHLQSGMMMISDDQDPQSIAGIMGGTVAGVTDRTVTVFLESAYWDSIEIARTGRQLKINSDARFRFERGVDPEFTIAGLDAATQMILECCGGEASHVVVAGNVPNHSRSYPFRPDRVKSLVGMKIPENEQIRSLTALGFKVDGTVAHVPSWRPDIQDEADLVEEVVRVASLKELKAQPLKRPSEGVTKPMMSVDQYRASVARRSCVALGYNECLTYSFIDKRSAKLFGEKDGAVQLENPISSEMSHMRSSLLPGLLMAAARNQARGFNDLALFELGPVFEGVRVDDQHIFLTGILIGRKEPREVHGSARNVDVFDVKADMEWVLSAIGAPSKTMILRGAPSWWHPGRHGLISLGRSRVLGVFGELHPRVLDGMDIAGPVMAFEVRLDHIPQSRHLNATRKALIVSDLQSVERDFSFLLTDDVEAGTVVKVVNGVDTSLIADVSVFDVFTGGQLDSGMKSIALRVRMEPKKKTLVDEDIEAVCIRIVEAVQRVTGGILRKI